MGAGKIEGLAGVLIWTERERFPAMAHFYRDLLGIAPRTSKSDFLNFDWGGVRLSVSVHDRVRGESRDPLRIMVNLAAFYEGQADKAKRQAWVDEFASAIRQSDTGEYVNFVTEEGEPGVHAAYPGATYDRLASIKAHYDPENLFRVNHNIPPAA